MTPSTQPAALPEHSYGGGSGASAVNQGNNGPATNAHVNQAPVREEALAELHAAGVQVVYRPFQLDQAAPT